jgi:general nucleoside transport system ATP-binding protein
MASAEAARLRGVTKRFFGVAVNDSVDLCVRAGEIHALLGENGAGKSTTCSILAGLYQPDAGHVQIRGRSVRFGSPADALAAGVGMVYQHFRLVDELTVAENVVLGHPEVPLRVGRRWLFERCREVAHRFGLQLEPDAVVAELAVGEQQRVEIARLLHRGVRVLILDEPTAVLTPQESHVLFQNVRRLTSEGHAIVIVTHKLSEVLAIADTITVMRHGRVVANGPANSYTTASLARQMVGRQTVDVEVSDRIDPPGTIDTNDGDVLEVSGLRVHGTTRASTITDLSLRVRAGEVLGICGVSGNGQRELAEALIGMRAAQSGSIRLNGREIAGESVAKRVALGMSYIPEDRLATGVAPGLSVEDNLLLRSYRDPKLRRGFLLDYARAVAATQALIDRFDVRGVRLGAATSALSGGNIQRVILAREISRRPSVVVACSPTRGLDVNATMEVRRVLSGARDDGLAVVLMSEDLEEVLAMSDRVVVMFHGELVGEFTRHEAAVEIIGELMAGVGEGAEP